MKRQDFTKFYKKHVGRIYKFVFFRVAGDRERAEDLTQDIFTKALDAFDRYDPSISESAWIYTIARNHIINTAAKERPHVDIEEVAHKLPGERENRAEEMYDEYLLFKALDALPRDEADLVTMKFLEGWKYREIAEITGKTSGSLRVQMSRILKKIRNDMKQKGKGTV